MGAASALRVGRQSLLSNDLFPAGYAVACERAQGDKRTTSHSNYNGVRHTYLPDVDSAEIRDPEAGRAKVQAIYLRLGVLL